MVYAKYRLSDGRFLCGWPQRPPYDAATEAVQDYPEHLRPDMRLHRFDATAPDKKRLATAQELADFDIERAALRAANLLDGPEAKMLKAIELWTTQKLNIQPATARAEILTIFKGL
jgi:hypothetical protein